MEITSLFCSNWSWLSLETNFHTKWFWHQIIKCNTGTSLQLGSFTQAIVETFQIIFTNRLSRRVPYIFVEVCNNCFFYELAIKMRTFLLPIFLFRRHFHLFFPDPSKKRMKNYLIFSDIFTSIRVKMFNQSGFVIFCNYEPILWNLQKLFFSAWDAWVSLGRSSFDKL